MTACIRAPRPGTHPVLPEGLQRTGVEHLLQDVAAAIGLTRALRDTLLRLIRTTRPSDWTRPDREPVCFMAQTGLADVLGLTPRSVRRHEAALVRLGLIERRVGANGARSALGGAGLVLSPLIHRIESFLALRAELEVDRRMRRALIRRRSVILRALHQQCEAAPSDVRARIVRKLASWPAAEALHALSLAELSAQLQEAEQVLEDGALDAARTSMSGRPDTTVRSQYEGTTDESLVFWTAEKMGKAAAVHDPSSRNPVWPVTGSARCGDAACANAAAGFEPARLAALASPEFRDVLEMLGASDAPTETALLIAAQDRAHHLAIAPSAWSEAIETMGRLRASIAVLVIDANRRHPKTPVRSPGGLLRDLTRRHARGGLNLAGSLIGLATRSGERVASAGTPGGAPAGLTPCGHRRPRLSRSFDPTPSLRSGQREPPAET
ncbi:MAG: replication initiation protein RepC [Pseudomonadota bacterium]